uniref:Uncharacterized protein n=1 Tax=Podoviridae sp. ct5cR14 TaxID=2825220 RepID=A0A8S5PS80_9CAUD|nr:MAG TPA: hypothetical protein [Podoviridae sp. ct5cR14]
MVDKNKIEAAANKHIETEYARYNSGEVEDEMICLMGKDSFKAGAKWMQEEFLKDLLHPASEVPRNDNGKILAFSKVNSNMNAMLYETACYTYQGKQEVRVREYTFTDLLFVEDLLDLIKKGGNHD